MNSATLNIHPSPLVPRISHCKTIREMKQFHALFIKTAQIQDLSLATEFLKLCATSDYCDTQYALSIFAQLPERNCFSWNTMIRALAESDDDYGPLDAFLLFCQMVSDGIVEPNLFTFPSVLKACSRVARLEEGKQVHGFVIKCGLDSDEFVMTNLLRMYVMCESMEDAQILFTRNIGAEDMNRMVRNSKRKRDGNVVLWNVMIDGYVILGNIKAACELFDRMHQRSVVSWNVMISANAHNGIFMKAIETFLKMQMEGVYPKPCDFGQCAASYFTPWSA